MQGKKKCQMHIAESRELPAVLLTLTLCSCQITIGPSLGLCKPMYIQCSRLIWPTRFGRCKVHCRQKFSLDRLRVKPGPNSDRHNLINQPAAPCLLNKNERCPRRRTICIGALPAEAALAGISVLMQPTPTFFFFTSPQVKPEPN